MYSFVAGLYVLHHCPTDTFGITGLLGFCACVPFSHYAGCHNPTYWITPGSTLGRNVSYSIRIVLTVTGGIQYFVNILSVTQTVTSMYAYVPKAQSCANQMCSRHSRVQIKCAQGVDMCKIKCAQGMDM